MISNQEGFTKVCKYSDLKEGKGKQFFINDVEIAEGELAKGKTNLQNILNKIIMLAKNIQKEKE